MHALTKHLRATHDHIMHAHVMQAHVLQVLPSSTSDGEIGYVNPSHSIVAIGIRDTLCLDESRRVLWRMIFITLEYLIMKGKVFLLLVFQDRNTWNTFPLLEQWTEIQQ